MTELKLTKTEKKNILAALSYAIGDLNKSADQMIEDEGIEAYRESNIPKHQAEYELLWRKVYESYK